MFQRVVHGKFSRRSSFEYMRRYPEMSVDIVTNDHLIDIVKDGFDAGVRLAEHLPGDMISVPIGPEQRLVVVGSPKYFKVREQPQHPSDLESHECIRRRLASGAIYRWEFERRGKKIEIDVPGRLSLDDTNLMQEAALAGLGLAYLSAWQVASEVKAGRLVQLDAAVSRPLPLLSRSAACTFGASRSNRSHARAKGEITTAIRRNGVSRWAKKGATSTWPFQIGAASA
jgi:DNA-binding transcriptional LysR family regulator